jgi:hypothetical protein
MNPLLKAAWLKVESRCGWSELWLLDASFQFHTHLSRRTGLAGGDL